MSRRRGGRTARRKAKATPTTGSVAPVRGGIYRPLAKSDIEKIHRAALTILDEIGMGDPISELIDLAAERRRKPTPQGGPWI